MDIWTKYCCWENWGLLVSAVDKGLLYLGNLCWDLGSSFCWQDETGSQSVTVCISNRFLTVYLQLWK